MVTGRCLLFFKVRGQRSRSFCHIVGKRCRRDAEWTVSSRSIQHGTIDHHDKRKVPIVYQGQRSRSNYHIVEKWCGQDTEWSVSSRILQLGTIDQHSVRKMSIVFSRSVVRGHTLWKIFLFNLRSPIKNCCLPNSEVKNQKKKWNQIVHGVSFCIICIVFIIHINLLVSLRISVIQNYPS